MNALYVTVSVALLFILAGSNHAHGLTTFGKSNQQNSAPPPPIQGKMCANHTDCRGINGTSCVSTSHDLTRKSCLCGNNQPPNNGKCPAVKKGLNHACNESDECENGTQCEFSKTEYTKVCTCIDNPDSKFGCNGAPLAECLSGMMLFTILASRILY